MFATLFVATPPKIQVCKYCERKLDDDFVNIGVCRYCLDNMDDDYDKECDKLYYGNIFDGRVEDEY